MSLQAIYNVKLWKTIDIKFPKSFLDWDCMLNPAAPNYKNSHPLVITLQVSLSPDQTLGECIKKWRLE